MKKNTLYIYTIYIYIYTYNAQEHQRKERKGLYDTTVTNVVSISIFSKIAFTRLKIYFILIEDYIKYHIIKYWKQTNYTTLKFCTQGFPARVKLKCILRTRNK